MRLKKRFLKGFLLSILVLGINAPVHCQQKTRYFSPEFMVGKIVPNYKGLPGSTVRSSYLLNIGTFLCDTNNHAHAYYHFPQVGISIGLSDLGNKENLGTEYSLVPYISLNASRGLRHSVQFKFGLGMSYFTKFYNEENNRYNRAIGSSLNWTFQAFVYYNLFVSRQFTMQLGGGYWHSSNAHLQLPNFGLNSAMVGVVFQYYLSDIDPGFRLPETMERHIKQQFIQVRAGLGWHEFGGTIGPVGGSKMPVYTTSINYGILYNRQLKFYGGFFYRFYSSFYDHLEENGSSVKNNSWQASNINFHLGLEYLLGHVGMNLEGGINLFKPFYDDYYDLFENGNSFNEFRMSMFNTRLGLNLYLKNTNKNPMNNFALGAHINANFGKADFGELSLTYMKIIQ